MVSDGLKQTRWEELWLYRQTVSVIADGFVGVVGEAYASPMVLAYKHDLERPAFQHSREPALALSDSKGLRGLVPLNQDGRADALLVVVAVVLVFIEREGAIGSAIDAKFDGIGGLFGRVLQLRTHRDDRARAYTQRNAIERRSGIDRPSPRMLLSGPEVVPSRVRQIHAAR